MEQFIQCMCYNNLSALVVQGEPRAEELFEAWESLFWEYCDLAEATETTYRTRLLSQIRIENTKNQLVERWVKIMEVHYSEKIANALRMVGFEYEFDPSDDDQYMNELSHVRGEVTVNKIRTRILEAEYEAAMQGQSTHDSVDEKYFRTTFFRINNYAKREAVNGQTFVLDYCVALKAYVDSIPDTIQTPVNRNGRI